MSDRSSSSGRRFSFFQNPDYVCSAVVSLIAIVYTWSIIDGALWGDEAQYALAGATIFSGNPFVNIVHMFAPLGKYLIGGGQLLFGYSSFGARIGIVFSSILTLTFLYFVARQMGRPWAGILSIVSLSTIPLFATHATSAMLDMPLVMGVTAMSGFTLLESRSPGGRNRDIAVGLSIIVVSSSKAYGFVYLIGPLLAYSVFIHRNERVKEAVINLGVSTVVSFFLVYLPLALETPPDYYSGASLPPFITQVFNTIVIGGPAYAFSSSLYFNVVAGHEGSTSPGILTIVSWIINGGPVIIAGSIVSLGAYFLPNRQRIKPWWMPTVIIAPSLVVFTLILPKGFARFALPVFPIIVLFASLTLMRGFEEIGSEYAYRKVAVFAIVLLAVSPATVFFLGGQALSADSQYDDVANTLSPTEDDIVVATDDRHELMWYLGDRYTERYYEYLNPTVSRVYATSDGGNITLISASNSSALINRIRTEEVDYVVLGDNPEAAQHVSNMSKTTRIQSWSAYRTGERGTHQVIMWSATEAENHSATSVDKIP